MTVIAMPSSLAFLNNTPAKVKSLYETVYLFLASLPARKIILSVICALVMVQGIRTALPFILLYAQWSPIVESLYHLLTAIDSASPFILGFALWFTKFNGETGELKRDVTWFVVGMVAKQFAWHSVRIVVASLIGNFTEMAAYLNWCWIWTIVYALVLYVIVTKGGAYVRSSKATNKTSKKA